jgi:hypothetical protein
MTSRGRREAGEEEPVHPQGQQHLDRGEAQHDAGQQGLQRECGGVLLPAPHPAVEPHRIMPVDQIAQHPTLPVGPYGGHVEPAQTVQPW